MLVLFHRIVKNYFCCIFTTDTLLSIFQSEKVPNVVPD